MTSDEVKSFVTEEMYEDASHEAFIGAETIEAAVENTVFWLTQDIIDLKYGEDWEDKCSSPEEEDEKFTAYTNEIKPAVQKYVIDRIIASFQK
ncbi:MAG: hypothetical protein IKQ61_07740 [Spirochaetales bacterium]|nr:hypothetical protein [Spirochaetales bacterium]MBR6061247.1 hypothetical protein [Spirochaetales bacterium]MBR6200135.1 hypothetical protein [Spirochaetales bacterium]